MYGHKLKQEDVNKSSSTLLLTFFWIRRSNRFNFHQKKISVSFNESFPVTSNVFLALILALKHYSFLLHFFKMSFLSCNGTALNLFSLAFKVNKTRSHYTVRFSCLLLLYLHLYKRSFKLPVLNPYPYCHHKGCIHPRTYR